MRADSASHLMKQPISFELFLFFYLICTLLLQKINIYKTNFHRVDLNLVMLVIVILSRRLTWSVLQQIQTHWKPKPTVKGGPWQGAKSRSSKGGNWAWDMLLWNWSVNVKRCIVLLCTIPAVVWSVAHLIQNTPVFNLLFLCYPLLLYFSLFGFTLEPRLYRERFKPPHSFLQHIDFSAPSRQHSSTTTHLGSKKLEQDLANHVPGRGSSPFQSGLHSTKATATHGNPSAQQNGPSSLHHRHKEQHQSSDPLRKVTSHVITNLRRIRSAHDPQNRVTGLHRSKSGYNSGSEIGTAGIKWNENNIMHRCSSEYSLLFLACTPDEVRDEADILLSDLMVRLKQLLFNSLLCAYYVGFIPMQFADGHLYYDKWWCVEHAFLVWANSFVILSSHLLPPNYCQILYQCSLHLGCWTRVGHDENAQRWSPDVIWVQDVVVQWNGESFRAEGPRNVAIPCDSSQECFYLLFNSRLHVHSWLLTMQCITVAFLMVVLLRSIFWFQTFSMSVLLIFNYFILYKLLYNRLLCRRSADLC